MDCAPSSAPPPGPVRALLRSMRPRQWSKNLLLFAGFLFTLNDTWTPLSPVMWVYLRSASLAFVLFCLLSSGVYLLNDLKDLERDRAHPHKRLRPLAAGQLRPAVALAVALVLLAVALSGSYRLRPAFLAVGCGYLALQVLYTLLLKHLVILDVLGIAIGFVLRAVGGAVAIGVAISPWLYTVTLLAALFLGLCKRRHELLLLSEGAERHRRILAEYSPQLLDQLIAIVASATIMAYSLYTFTSPRLPQNHLMMLTIPLVLYGMFRYLYLVHRRDAGGSPEEVLLRDGPLIATVLAWAAAAALILAIGR
ncbi:MAG: decaprenyl-phosphate phosphoribosyltransferase [Myxococcales bacterium]|nr:decaprenyl-phosphate phosphoribosyltransferase [Myxococcota bacterium]MDW8283274.1 decaprenyl-phosphate phosphoribosyltransferase [Myxococcales bacterium]